MIRRCCSSTPAWCPSSRISSEKRRRRIPARPARRRSCAPWTSKRSARLRVTRRSSRWRATFRSVTTSRKGRFPSRGSCSPSRSPTVATDSMSLDCGSRCISTTTRPSIFGTGMWVFRWIAFSDAGRPTTTGLWGCQGRADPVRRSTTTEDPTTASREVLLPTRTATSKCGTWFSCNSSEVPVRQKRTTPS